MFFQVPKIVKQRFCLSSVQFSHSVGFVSFVMVESSDKMWLTREGNGKPLKYSCLENPMKSMKRDSAGNYSSLEKVTSLQYPALPFSILVYLSFSSNSFSLSAVLQFPSQRCYTFLYISWDFDLVLVMTFTNISFFPHYGSYLVSSDGLESAELLYLKLVCTPYHLSMTYYVP